jgi:hypothetical protein
MQIKVQPKFNFMIEGQVDLMVHRLLPLDLMVHHHLPLDMDHHRLLLLMGLMVHRLLLHITITIIIGIIDTVVTEFIIPDNLSQ